MKQLLRSGWWVAVAATAILVIALVLIVRPGPSTTRGDGSRVESYGFDLSCLQVPLHTIVGGGMARDGLHGIDDPTVIAGSDVAAVNEAERGKLLVPDDRIIGVFLNGEACAYPLRLMRWHEVVNDNVGGVPVVVTYSGLGDASAVWRRSVADAESAFAVSGLVHDSNTVLYDRTPVGESLWSQLTGRALAGPAACSGLNLEGVPAEVSTWSDWFSRHPETTVLAPLPGLKRLYKRDPYHSYFGSEVLHFPIDPAPPAGGPAAKDHVVVVEFGNERRVLDLESIVGTTEFDLGGTALHIHTGTAPATARLEMLSDDPASPTLRLSFWFAWHAQNPDDLLWPLKVRPGL